MTANPPPDLFEQVLHAIEGEDTERQAWRLPDGTTKVLERKFFGPEKWIRKVQERGILTPLQLLALIHFALLDFRDPKQDERRIVEGWNAALVDAASKRKISPRDPDSLLLLDSIEGAAEWVMSIADADAFVASRGMTWTCAEIAAHLFNEFFSNDVTGAGTAPPLAHQTQPATLQVDRDWTQKAREIAQEIGETKWHRGEREITARNIADGVATQLAKMESKYWGIRGPRSANGVRNEALKGWKFRPPEDVA